jgi:hypothetical protein
MLRYFGLIVLLISGTANGQGHWKMVGSFDGTMCPYFLNDSLGFAYNNTGGIASAAGGGTVNSSRLLKTTSGGRTWNASIGQLPQNVADMFFVSPTEGYAACNASSSVSSSGTGVYQTTDGAQTWRRITPNVFTNITGVYSIHDTVFVSNPGLYFSSDHGATWSNLITSKIGSPAGLMGSVVGNAESAVLSTDGGSGKDNGVIYTTDGGITWSKGNGTYAAFSAVYLPHTSECFKSEEEWYDQSAPLGHNFKDDGGHVSHSVDGGKTWITQSMPGQPGLTGGIGTGGCNAVYVQRGLAALPDSGLIRTTDHGSTWVAVGGPSGVLDHRLSVVGAGATVFAMDQYFNIWKTTDGGDGALSASDWSNLTLTASALQMDTIRTKVCDSTSFSLSLTNSGCLRYYWDSVAVEGCGPNTYYSTLSNRFIGNGQSTGSLNVTIVAHQAGDYTIKVHRRLRREDWLELDTVLNLVLHVNPNPGTLSLNAKPLYDFGDQNLCHPTTVTDSFKFSAEGCGAVTIDSMRVQGISGDVQNFSVGSVSRLTLSSASGVKAIPVSYKASSGQIDSARIVVYWSDGVKQHSDTVFVRGAGVSDSRTFVIGSPTATTRKCDSTLSVITVHNPTCHDLQVDSISLPNGLELRSSGSSIMSPGDSAKVSLTIDASGSALHTGDTTLLAILHIRYQGVSFDTLVPVIVHIDRGVSLATVDRNALDFGTISACRSTTLSIQLNSTGCDTLLSVSSSLEKQDAFYLTKTVRSAIANGSSDSAIVTFKPFASGKTFYDTLHITTSAGSFDIPIQGASAADRTPLNGGHVLASLPDVIAGCGGDSTELGFPNESCRNIIVDSVLVNRPFHLLTGIGDTVYSVDSISNRTSWKTSVSYLPTVSGQDTCWLHVYYHSADGTLFDTVLWFSAKALAVPSMTLYLKSDAGHNSVNGRFEIPIYATGQGSVSNANITAVKLRLNFNTNLISPISVSYSNTLPPYDNAGIDLSIPVAAGFNPASETEIARVSCQAFVTDTLATVIGVSNSSLVSGSSCIEISTKPAEVSFAIDQECGDSMLSRFIRSRSIQIKDVRPNPAATSITVTLIEHQRTELQVQLFDCLGREVLSAFVSQSQVKLDVSSLPQGAYYLRMSEVGSNAAIGTRRVEIVR